MGPLSLWPLWVSWPGFLRRGREVTSRCYFFPMGYITLVNSTYVKNSIIYNTSFLRRSR